MFTGITDTHPDTEHNTLRLRYYNVHTLYKKVYINHVKVYCTTYTFRKFNCVALCGENFNNFPLFDATLRRKELRNIVISHIQ